MSEVVYTVENFQGDIKQLFDAFADDYTKQEILMRGNKYIFMELNERNNCSTVFQMTAGFQINKIMVNFSQNGKNINVNYLSTQEVNTAGLTKMQIKTTEKKNKKIGEKKLKQVRYSAFVRT